MSSRHIEAVRRALPYSPDDVPAELGGGGVRTVSAIRPVLASRQPSEDPGDRVQTGTRVLLAVFTLLTLVAAISLLVLRDHTDIFFAWTIHSRPNGAFLGAAYVAGFVMSALALRQESWRRVRVALVTVTAFTMLTLVPSVVHMHRLHLMADDPRARLAAAIWVVAYVLVPIAGVAVVVRQQRARPGRDVRRPMPRWLAAVLVGQGAALAAAGAVLYAGGATMHAAIEMPRPGWPWPATPMMSEAIGAWLLAFGFAIAVALRERDLSRMLVPSVAYAAFGVCQLVVLIVYRAAPRTDSLWWWVDLAVLVMMIATGAYGASQARRG